MNRSEKFVFYLIIVLALFVRIFNLQVPIVEPYNSLTRQAMVGEISRNFYEHGFNFFYPELDENGHGPDLFNGEMPIYSYLMALGYFLAGGVHEWVARLVSVLFSLGTVAYVYLLVRNVSGGVAAMASLLFISFSPLNVAISRCIQPEATMICATAGALYYFERYCSKKSSVYFLLSGLMGFYAVATKIQSLYLVVPVSYLFWSNREWLKTNKKIWLYPVFLCLPLIWYAWMWRLGQQGHSPYPVYSFSKARGPQDVGYWGLFAPAYLSVVLRYTVLHVLTPLGSFFFLLGIIRGIFAKQNRLYLFWMLSVLMCFLILWRIVIEHSYYQMPLIPIAACYIGVGVKWMFESGLFKKRSWRAIVLFMGVLSLLNFIYLCKGLYWIPSANQRIVIAGRAADRILPKNSLVLASYGGSPIQLYYCHRKGWSFDFRGTNEEKMIEDLEKARTKKADFFITTTLDMLKKAPKFENYLRSHYQVLQETADYIIFDLRRTT